MFASAGDFRLFSKEIDTSWLSFHCSYAQPPFEKSLCQFYIHHSSHILLVYLNKSNSNSLKAWYFLFMLLIEKTVFLWYVSVNVQIMGCSLMKTEFERHLLRAVKDKRPREGSGLILWCNSVRAAKVLLWFLVD